MQALRANAGPREDLCIDHRNDRRYASRQHESDRQGEGRRRPSPGQARVLQSDLERQGPHRRRDDRRARGAGQDFARTRRSGRADFRQHRHCARLRGGGARLPADPGDARIDVDRAPQDAGPPRGRTGPDARRAGHERRDRQGERDRQSDARRGHAAAVRESRQSGNSSPDHGGGNLERHRGARSTSSSPASAPAGRSPGSARC